MPIYKKTLIFTILTFITLIYFFNTLIDLSRLIDYKLLYTSFPNEAIKRVNVLLAAALVWLAGRNCINPQDNRIMKYVFVFITGGELCFLFAEPALAIGFFAICQDLLIARHGKGLAHKLTSANLSQSFKLGASALALITLLFIGIILLNSLSKQNTPVLVGVLYGTILCISLWTGLACYILRLFPYKNSKMIAIGMLCFFFCDVFVGLDGLLRPGPAWVIASSLIWVFYTPAITLLALSCYMLSSSLSKP